MMMEENKKSHKRKHEDSGKIDSRDELRNREDFRDKKGKKEKH